MEFHNTTALDTRRLHGLVLRYTEPWRHEKLVVRVRYSRGADFSGTCFYRDGRIYVNIGRHVRFPYELGTHVAKACETRSGWRREVYRLRVRDGYQLVLFVYLHELYHYLVALAGRSPRRKEAMCDRFATRVLVDDFGCRLRDRFGRPVPRETWDFQDLEAFVARARRSTRRAVAARRAIPVKIVR